VEHPVTELVYGIDLVHWQLRIANGERLTITQDAVTPRGWALETRIYAEDPANRMLPSTGTITRWDPPEGPGIRVDEGVERGSDVSVYYDPMLAKLIVWGEDRAVAIARLTRALEDFAIGGIRGNVPLLLWIARDEAFRKGDTTTSFLSERLDESIFAAKRQVPESVIAAAAGALLRERRAPWRIGGIGVPLRFQTAGETIALEANATADPGAWQIAGDVQCEIRIDDRSAKADVDDRGVIVYENGQTWNLHFAEAPSADVSGHHAHGGANGRIVSPMPGKIVKVAVKDGDDVGMHDLLVVLEAMKMEHRIEAPSDGKVAAIHVREGDIVSGESLLLEIN
jgi:3-methylcrotonyl-CoA carboxylase alpha subunit